MYLMHALRNFGTSFRLPERITPTQAARILGLEGLVRGGADPAGPVSSSQELNSAPAYSGNGGLQGPQQAAGGDWEATGGLSPSQQQAVEEMTALGFAPQQCQVRSPPTPALRRSTTDRSSYSSAGTSAFPSACSAYLQDSCCIVHW